MVSNAERFLGDETEPNSAANEWDMSDAPAFSSEDFIYFPVIKTIIYMNSGFGHRPYLSDIDIYGSAVKYPQCSGKIFREKIQGKYTRKGSISILPPI